MKDNQTCIELDDNVDVNGDYDNSKNGHYTTHRAMVLAVSTTVELFGHQRKIKIFGKGVRRMTS